jgi:hypothetical protein
LKLYGSFEVGPGDSSVSGEVREGFDPSPSSFLAKLMKSVLY